MSDKKKSDPFTQLGHAALDARHNGTPPERAEAACLTLLGKLARLPPGIALMTEAPWAEVAQVAISPEGKIAVLGIEPGGAKEIVEWKVIDRRWTSRVVDGTGAEMRVDYLHYPADSEDVAFSVTRPDGKTRVFWGDWKFDANEVDSSKVVGVYCYAVDYGMQGLQRRCIVVRSGNGNGQQGELYLQDERTVQPPVSIAHGDQVTILGRFDNQIAILRIQEGRQSVCLVDLVGHQHWGSDRYDRILEGSVMERDGELSFVGLRMESQQSWALADAYLVSRSGSKQIAEDIVPRHVRCFKGGQVLFSPREMPGEFDEFEARGLPLYTPIERLVHTEEGILSWHFVNGTFIIIRYPL